MQKPEIHQTEEEVSTGPEEQRKRIRIQIGNGTKRIHLKRCAPCRVHTHTYTHRNGTVEGNGWLKQYNGLSRDPLGLLGFHALLQGGLIRPSLTPGLARDMRQAAFESSSKIIINSVGDCFMSGQSWIHQRSSKVTFFTILRNFDIFLPNALSLWSKWARATWEKANYRPGSCSVCHVTSDLTLDGHPSPV